MSSAHQSQKTRQESRQKFSHQKIPVNIVTGFLGSGKTTIIKNLLTQLPNPEETIWLKNEYGDDNVDALLVRDTHVKPVEILNGCLCCVLVGRLHDALREIINKNKPKRIIIETSGTAWPGPIVRQVKRLPELYVDSVVYVVDVINFSGYDDLSYAAKMQTQFVDLVVFNKYPHNVLPGSKEELDLEHKLDDVYEIFPSTPKLNSETGKVAAKFLLGLESLAELADLKSEDEENKDEEPGKHKRGHESNDGHEHPDHVETFTIQFNPKQKLARSQVANALRDLSELGIIRIKGLVPLETGPEVINWVYGRWNWQPLIMVEGEVQPEAKLVFMGERIKHLQEKVAEKLTLPDSLG